MQNHFDPKKLPPITTWQVERKTLSADKKKLDAEFYKIWKETATVEKIKRSVDDILNGAREQQPQKSRGMER